MSTNFPGSLDTFTNPSASDEVGVEVGGRTHSEFHADNNDAIEALEAKVGVDGSAVTTSHDYKLSGVTGSDKAASLTGTENLTNKTLISPSISGTVTDTATTTKTGTLDATGATVSVYDANFSIKDNSDPTKIAKFQASGINPSTTRTYTLPDADDTLVGKATADIFTNKTIDANGTGNSISNIEVADFAGSAIVTEAEGLASSDNDTSIPTTAAVKDYVDDTAATGVQKVIYSSFTAGEDFTGGTSPQPAFIGDNTEEFVGGTTTPQDQAGGHEKVFSGTDYFAKPFTPSQSGAVKRIKFYADKADPISLTYTVSIRADSGGVPSSTDLAVTASLNDDSGDGAISTSGGVVTVDFSSAVHLTASTQYWIVFRSVSISGGGSIWVEYATSGGGGIYSSSDGSSWSLDGGTGSYDLQVAIYAVFENGKLYQSDASNGERDKYNFLVINTVSLGSTSLQAVQVGIVSGLTGITAGSTYYVSDTRGTLATSAGTNSIKVGKAISTTELVVTDNAFTY